MQAKVIKQKMKSVANIGKITKAMEMISVSKMKKAVQKRSGSFLFATESFNLLENLAGQPGLRHPYLESGKGTKILLVVIASNKGLCGGYNMNVSKKVAEFVKENTQDKVEVIAVGKQSQKIARRNNLTVISHFDDFSENYTSEEVRLLLHTILNNFNNGTYKEVRIVYTEFISAISYKTQMRKFIPFPYKKISKIKENKNLNNEKINLALYTLEPNEQEVLNTVVPAVLLTLLFQYLLEGLASEHSSRVTAMKNASDNAQSLGEELKVNFNRARQAAITQEIAEIVGGSSV